MYWGRRDMASSTCHECVRGERLACMGGGRQAEMNGVMEQKGDGSNARTESSDWRTSRPPTTRPNTKWNPSSSGARSSVIPKTGSADSCGRVSNPRLRRKHVKNKMLVFSIYLSVLIVAQSVRFQERAPVRQQGATIFILGVTSDSDYIKICDPI